MIMLNALRLRSTSIFHNSTSKIARFFSVSVQRHPLLRHFQAALVRGFCGLETKAVSCYPEIRSQQFSNEALQKNEDFSDDEEESDDIFNEVGEANIRCHGSLEVRKTNGQWGVHATRQFAKGELVISSNLRDDTTKPKLLSCAHSIQIGWNQHILMDLPARYLNHSCKPNIGVSGLNSNGSYDFVALVDIDSDEELNFDYETTEYEVGAFSQCGCGSCNCRGEVCGYKYTGHVIRKLYSQNNIAAYLFNHGAAGKSG